MTFFHVLSMEMNVVRILSSSLLIVLQRVGGIGGSSDAGSEVGSDVGRGIGVAVGGAWGLSGGVDHGVGDSSGGSESQEISDFGSVLIERGCGEVQL